jgi:hypothetical protein
MYNFYVGMVETGGLEHRLAAVCLEALCGFWNGFLGTHKNSRMSVIHKCLVCVQGSYQMTGPDVNRGDIF